MSNFSNLASQVYGQGQPINLAVPRNKFQFQVIIHYNGTYIKLEKISEMQMPSHTMKTQTLNQYNKKRIVQTGIDYTPVTLVAYDTRDAEIERFLIGYNNHYYSSPMSDTNMSDDIINEQFAGTGGTDSTGAPTTSSGKGFNLTDKRYYITKIEIIRTSSSDDKNIIEIYNPIITSIQSDTLNYSESAPVQYRIDFAYEGYNITTNGEVVADKKLHKTSSPQERAVTSVQAANELQATNPATIAGQSINPDMTPTTYDVPNATTNATTNANGLTLVKSAYSGSTSSRRRNLQTGVVTTTSVTKPSTTTVYDENGATTTVTRPKLYIVEVFDPRTGITTTTTTDTTDLFNSTVVTTNSLQPGVSALDVLVAKDAHAYNETIEWDNGLW
jgi:hypothetical protein